MSVRFEMRVTDALMARIDAARGAESRAAWIKSAAEFMLVPEDYVPGQPSRVVKIAISLPADLFDQVEKARGPRARSSFIARALDAALSEANGSPRAIQAARDPVGSSDGEPVRAAAPRRASASPAMARQAKLNESKAKAKR